MTVLASFDLQCPLVLQTAREAKPLAQSPSAGSGGSSPGRSISGVSLGVPLLSVFPALGAGP